MGLQDRDYTRRRPAVSAAAARPKERSWLFTAGAVIAVAGVAAWLLRDFRFSAPASTPSKASSIVDLNHATQAQLEAVPGIGPGLAPRIIAARPYRSVDDLVRVSGIGEKTLERMRRFLTTDGAR